jgi:hypothetical protein
MREWCSKNVPVLKSGGEGVPEVVSVDSQTVPLVVVNGNDRPPLHP